MDPSSIARRTLSHYERGAEEFWEGTRTHDVTQNYAALLSAIEGSPPFRILDLGCGPGRDLAWFRAAGHHVVGVDGSAAFVGMASEHAGVEVLHQDMTALSLGARRFEGVFANASLFHVPTVALPTLLAELHRALVPRGVLFMSNPRGDEEEGFRGDRYGCYRELDGWRRQVEPAGFELVTHYYRPEGRPRAEQPWLAIVFRRVEIARGPLRWRAVRATTHR